MANSYFYSNTAQPTTLTGSISAGATALNVGATTGFPGSFPYVLAVDYGAGTEELVKVTSAAATTLTVERGFSGTSAQSHSIGAVVKHVFHAGDATDFRTHEAATAAVHGVSGTLVGTSDTQTLANKTLTAPTITAPTMTGGGSLAGTYTGTPTFSGAVVLSGTPNISSGAALAGTFTGTPTFNGAVVLSGTPSITNGAALAGTLTGTPTFSGNVTYTGEIILSNLLRGSRGSSTDSAYETRVTGDSVARWFVRAGGDMYWGPGNAAVDTTLYRSAADTLKTDDNLIVAGNLTVSGVGQTQVAIKTGDTSRTSTTTTTADPHLTFTVAANATYIVDGWIKYEAHSSGDLALDWGIPTGALGEWTGWGIGLSTTTSTGDGYPIRVETNDVSQFRTFAGLGAGVEITAMVHGTLRVQGTGGTYSLDWAQATSNATATTLFTDSWVRLYRVS